MSNRNNAGSQSAGRTEHQRLTNKIMDAADFAEAQGRADIAKELRSICYMLIEQEAAQQPKRRIIDKL